MSAVVQAVAAAAAGVMVPWERLQLLVEDLVAAEVVVEDLVYIVLLAEEGCRGNHRVVEALAVEGSPAAENHQAGT